MQAGTSQYLELGEDEATVLAYNEGFDTVRITARDKRYAPVTRDYRTDRMNFRIEFAQLSRRPTERQLTMSITPKELLGAIEAQCDVESSGAENCVSVIGPLDIAELASTINYLNTH